MKANSLLLVAIIVIAFNYVKAQNNDCCIAKVICGAKTVYANPIGYGNNDFAFSGNSHGCLDSLEKNSVWYYFKMNKNTPPESILGFLIDPDGGNAEDFDFALYGPNVKCGNLGEPLRCSFAEKFCTYCPNTGMWSKANDYTEDKLGDGFVKSIKVNAGEAYYLLIQNYTGSNIGFKLNFTDKASDFIECNPTLPCCLNITTPPDITICSGSAPFQLKSKTWGGTPIKYIWESTGTGFNYLSNPKDSSPWVTIPETFIGTINYTIKVYDGICQSESSIKVIVNPKPKVYIDSIGPVCNNSDAIKLKGFPLNASWSGAANNEGIINPVDLKPGKHGVTLSYTNQFSCYAEQSTEIEILEITNPKIENIDTICSNSKPLQLYGIPAGGKWSGELKENGQFVPKGYSGKFNAFYTYTNTNGCKAVDSSYINVMPAPLVKIQDPGMLCSSEENYKMIALPNGGSWKGIADPNGMIHPYQLVNNYPMAYYLYADQYGCSNMDSLEIKLMTPPSASLIKSILVCNSTDSGKKTTINFEELIQAGSKNGEWKDLNNSNCSGTLPEYNFNKVKPGTYYFSYKVTSGSTVCPDFIDTIAIIVEDCECPEIELITPVIACNSEKSIDLDNYKLSAGSGQWLINSNPLASDIAFLNGSKLITENKAPGNYTLIFTLFPKPIEGCPESAQLDLILNQSPEVKLPASVEVCNDHDSNYPNKLNLYNLIDGTYKGGEWIDKDNSGATGSFYELDFTNVKSGKYVFQYTTSEAIAPCTNNTYYVNINVNDCSCPDLSLLPGISLCKDLGVYDLELLKQNSIPGKWLISSFPGTSNLASLSNNLFNFITATTGKYTLKFEPLSLPPIGCPNYSETVLDIIKPPFAGTSVNELKICEREDLTISLSDQIKDEDPYGIWSVSNNSSDPGGHFDNKSGIIKINELLPGNYAFQYKVPGIYPCPEDISNIQLSILPNPLISAGKDLELNCEDISAQLGKDIILPNSYTYTWKGPGIINPNLLQPIVKIPGTYIAMFKSNISICKSNDTLEVYPAGNPIMNIEAKSNDVACKNAKNGKININEISGGTPDYRYSINNSTPGTSPEFDNLSSGTYSLHILDSKGCSYDTIIQIGVGDGFSLDLGPDLFVSQGDQYNITPVLNIPESDISSILWSPINCENCFTIHEIAENTSNYKVQIIDKNGCKAEDELNVFVKKRRNVFIPNVFSPNGDGINDILFINAGEGISEVSKMEIFDRWGTQLFSKSNFPPNDPSLGWDGSFKQRPLNSDVYVYWALIKFTDGESILYKGDITLQK